MFAINLSRREDKRKARKLSAALRHQLHIAKEKEREAEIHYNEDHDDEESLLRQNGDDACGSQSHKEVARCTSVDRSGSIGKHRSPKFGGSEVRRSRKLNRRKSISAPTSPTCGKRESRLSKLRKPRFIYHAAAAGAAKAAVSILASAKLHVSPKKKKDSKQEENVESEEGKEIENSEAQETES